jgi:hypothetical protein
MLWLIGFAVAFFGSLFAGDFWWATVMIAIFCLIGYFATAGKKVLAQDAAIVADFTVNYAANARNLTKKTNDPTRQNADKTDEEGKKEDAQTPSER